VISLTIAFRSLLRRKSRVILIALLVVFGTMLLVLGTTISRSAGIASRQSIIRNFTGDFIVYSARSREIPSPFAFTTPLPVVPDMEKVTAFLSAQPEVETFVPFAQNYSLLSVQKDGSTVDMPFIFYAVDPAPYARTFGNAKMVEGDFLAGGSGILVSRFQNDTFEKRYGVRLKVGQDVTVLGLSDGGSVNAYPTKVRGIFEPRYYRNVFDYINFIDITAYSQVYNFTGVAAGSLPPALESGLAAAQDSEDAVFALAGSSTGSIDTTTLKSEAVSGYTMIAVRLKDGAASNAVRARLDAQGLEVKTARWDEASGFFSRISSALGAFIYLATALIFLVVAFIFMNTLIINIVERTGEIGTIRALGGEKGLIRAIFLSETLMVNVAACLLGMAVSLAVILAAGPSGLPLPDIVSQFLIGGGPLPLALSAGPFITSLAVVVGVSVLATLLPIRVATKITPLAAMNDR
jgi:ABC-type lipoprotein release transport system permease subunit